jgi:HD-GYP domain-containing protein (c-di-GMP phosphodiesterase class II)/GGDEF domain-containing protein
MDRSNWNRLGPGVAAGLAVAALALALVLGLAGAGLAAAGVVGGIILLTAAALAIDGWRIARERARHLESVAEALRTERAAEGDQLKRHSRRLEDALSHERVLLERLRRAWKAEREWSSELRRQLQELQSRSGGSGRGDLLELVLQAAIRLLEAEKGLLLTRGDEDGDGDLDMVTAQGFSHDPEHSAVAQRFAREVLARDQIVREDDPSQLEDGRTEADQEIDELVAIPLYLRDRFHGVIVCANRPGGFAEVDDDVLLALGNQAGAALNYGQLGRDLREAHHALIRVLVELLSARDPVLQRESDGLVPLVTALARDLGLDDDDRDALICAVLLRNVGFLPLSERLLLRPGPLSPDERALIELHPRLGFDVLRRAPHLRDVATTVLYHHERVDGTGYPAGLEGQDIPLAARALAVVEAYGSLTHERPHRPARDPESACRELIEHAGTQFEPEIVQLLVERVRRAPGAAGEAPSGIVFESLPPDRQGDDTELGPLTPSTTDGLTLLGDHRALQRDVLDAAGSATRERSFAVVMLELPDLPRINDEVSYLAGDRLIQIAARQAGSAAGRLGATAYRASGRRLALLVPLRPGDDLGDVLQDIRTEFLAGPVVQAVASAWKPGDRGENVLARARSALKHPSL